MMNYLENQSQNGQLLQFYQTQFANLSYFCIRYITKYDLFVLLTSNVI